MNTTQSAEQALQPLMKQVSTHLESLQLRGELRQPADKLKDLHAELRRLETQIDDISMLYSDLRQRKALVVREIMLLERDGQALGAPELPKHNPNCSYALRGSGDCDCENTSP